jgi:aspartate beta-hydroxylase
MNLGDPLHTGSPGEASFERVQQLARAGRLSAAETVCKRIVAMCPDHPDALNFLASLALRRGDPVRGCALLQQALQVEPRKPLLHKNLAFAYAMRGDFDAALDALNQALALAPDFALAHLHKGEVLESLGRECEALESYYTGVEQGYRQGFWAQPAALPPKQRGLLEHAVGLVEAARERFIGGRLAPIRERYGAHALARVDQCIEIQLGRRPRENPHPRQQPTRMAFPGLPARNFFPREQFPMFDSLEEATPNIQAELASVLAGSEGFQPFIHRPDGQCEENWRALNDSPDWNAFFFYRDGVRWEDNCRRCPKTAAALDAIDLCRVPGHGPEAFFSVLTPGTHIPLHTGMTNTRLTCHLPLVIPDNCGIRIGGEDYTWREGRCIIFDDTFEHEAWNGSERTRIVLIFDIWNPDLTAIEREALSVVIDAMVEFKREMRAQP